MSDQDTAPLAGDLSTEPQSRSAPEAREAERPSESWLERIIRAVGLRPAHSARDEIEDALEDPDAFTPEERRMLRNLLDLSEIRVEDVMVPRADILAVEIGWPIAEVVAAFRDSGHSRMPVYRETLDDPVGMVHIKDLMNWLTKAAETGTGLGFEKVDLSTPLEKTDLVRRVLFVPPSMPAAALLATMRESRVQMALVIDEHGGVDGLASLEDVVEIVFGEIEDEHDEDAETLIVPDGEGVFLVDGRIDLDDVEAVLGEPLAAGAVDSEVDTLGGLVFTLLGRIPRRGERVVVPGGYELDIVDADTRRVRRVRLYRPGFAPELRRMPRLRSA